MAADAAEAFSLKLAQRPHVDLSGARPGNTATGLMRAVHEALNEHPDLMVHSAIHDGDLDTWRSFYVVPALTMQKLFAAAGVDYDDILKL